MKKKHYPHAFPISRFLQVGMMAVMAFAVLALPVASNAQETTSSIRGKIVDASGNSVGNASIVVEDLRSGVQRTYSTSADGLFLATRLLPGGPYRVTVNGTKSVDVPTISIGDTYNLSVSLASEAAIEEIIAIGQQADLVETAAGPAATFNIDQIENSVSFGRDISDIYAIDPRMFVDAGEVESGINCVGKNPRFNRVTLDGVSVSDSFGLNDNGYSTAVGMPFPLDAIEQIAVEMAPFDTNYSGFSACNINAVTKSGTNDWQAKAFYEYSSNSFRGDHVPGTTGSRSLDSYDKTYYGFDVGGPIIEDKLFIFTAYEKSDDPKFLAQGYSGSGNGVDHPWLSQADFNRIANIAQSVYNYDAGGEPGNGARKNEKYVARLDWNISDQHNLAFIYNYFKGDELRLSDYGSTRLEFSNHMYVKGAEAKTYTLKLSSQWNDALSTELFWSKSSMDDSQVTVGDKDFAEMRIDMGSGNTVYIGADDSRQANELSTDTDYLKLTADYLVGNHVITAGFDSQKLDTFDVFVQQSRGGEYLFSNSAANANDATCAALTAQQRYDGVNGCGPTGMDLYELGRPTTVYYGSGGGTNDPNDAAAVFTNTLNALFVQDEIFFDDLGLTLTAGLRYEKFSSNDIPTYNANFEALTGVPNDTGLDGLDLLMPRLGFRWDVRDDLTLRGGVGLFAGGNPNVWIANAWSNDGLTNAQFSRSQSGFTAETGTDTYTILPGFADSVELSGSMRPGYDVPQAMVDSVLAVTPSQASTRFMALIDPKYKQPAEWKMAFGGTWDMPIDMSLDFDILYARGKDPAYYRDLSQAISGTTILGTPVYDYLPGLVDDYMLTNSKESPITKSVSLVLRKDFDFGLRALLGYAWTQAEDVVPMTSSTAGSNFDNVALLDINYPKAAKSNWVTPNRFTLNLDYAHTFFGDNETRFILQGFVNQGQPQTYVMQGTALEGDGFFGRHFLYIPDGPSDPNVVFGANFDQAAFFEWVDKHHLKPGFVKRNEFNTGWTSRFDLRISQEIPLGSDFRGRLYLKIYNFGNLLNKDWGKVTDAEFFSPQIVTTLSSLTPTGQFQYNRFTDNRLQTTIQERSLWEARLGIDVAFGQ